MKLSLFIYKLTFVKNKLFNIKIIKNILIIFLNFHICVLYIKLN